MWTMGTIRGATPRDEAKLLSYTLIEVIQERGYAAARQHIEDCVTEFIEATLAAKN